VYDIPDHLLVAGRKVRCARCGQDWFPAGPKVVAEAPPPPPVNAPAPGPAAEPDAGVRPDHGAGHTPPPTAMDMPPEHSAMDRLAKEAGSPSPTPLPLKAAWAVSLATLVLLIAGAIVWHADIAQAWPPGQRVLSVFGGTMEARAGGH